MAFKDLFIKSDENPNEKPKVNTTKESSSTKFPTAETPIQSTETPFKSTFAFSKSTPTINKGDVSPEHVAKAVERYQKGFESLNQPGYDFFEYYQTVTDAGVENAMAFTMAFKMGQTMDKTITKDSLISQAQFYETEINKSYQESITNGNAKKQDLLNQKQTENQALTQELSYMKEQFENMKIQIQNHENKLNLIGDKYQPQLNEIDSKLAANDIAKNQLVQSIGQVKQGIINNLK